MFKMSCAIVGSGNIGTDLMIKIVGSDYLAMGAMVGIDPGPTAWRAARRANELESNTNGITAKATTDNKRSWSSIQYGAQVRALP